MTCTKVTGSGPWDPVTVRGVSGGVPTGLGPPHTPRPSGQTGLCLSVCPSPLCPSSAGPRGHTCGPDQHSRLMCSLRPPGPPRGPLLGPESRAWRTGAPRFIPGCRATASKSWPSPRTEGAGRLWCPQAEPQVTASAGHPAPQQLARDPHSPECGTPDLEASRWELPGTWAGRTLDSVSACRCPWGNVRRFSLTPPELSPGGALGAPHL